MVPGGSLLVLVGLFLLGVVLVIYSVEVFIEAVAQSAVSLGISGFFLAVVLAGVDLENAVLGVTAAVVELPEIALGTVFGEALFVLAVAAGLAGVLVPFRMDVPRAYLLLLVAVPLPTFALSLDGTIDPVEGAALVALFVPLLAFVYWRERRSETTYLLADEVEAIADVDAPGMDGASSPAEPTNGGTHVGSEDEAVAGNSPADDGPADDDGTDHVRAHDDVPDAADDDRWDLDLDPDEFVPDLEGRSGAFALSVAVLATVGLTVGSLITVVSAEGISAALGISGLAFGATVLSFVASIEELALTVEPVRRGAPQLAVGNVVGSTVFYVTANVGLIALLHPVATDGVVLTIHWPFFAACLLVVTAMLARGRVTRLGGAALLGLYLAYWIVNYA